MRKEHKLNHVLTSLISRLLLNINTEKEEKILLTMIAPEKLKLEIQPETEKGYKRHIQRIECKIIGKPSSNNVWWTKKTKEQNIERNIDTTQEGYSGGTVDCPSLTIFGFKETDGGIYICRATNEAGEGLSNESILQYIEPPTLKVFPDEQHVVKGTDQRLDCSISGIPKPVITWMKGDIKIDLTIDQYKYSGGTDESPSLIIKSFEISDEGVYVCKAVNEAGEGTSNQSYLTFIAPPTVKVSSYAQDVVKGEDHTLNSDIFGIPKPVITWMKLVNGEYKILDLLKEKYFGGTCDCPSLTIKLFNTNDDGIYVCKATNIAGEQTSNATCLTCIELPTVRITPDKENVIRGKTQTLKCFVSGIPKPRISWKREISGEETIIDLSLDKYVEEYGDYPSLTIIDFNVTDEGRYFCTATNKVGEAISNISFLKYYEKPEILIKPKAKRVAKGFSQTIVCCMSGTPIPKIITWTRITNELEIPVDLTSDKYSGGTADCPSLTINSFNEADDGNYRCRATNEAGEGLSNFPYFATKFSVDD
ncbi:HMCN [Mytilus edulis]|uniref:HMCN n=1 Tax=Mytilus edulis TaxID=6550 RepID=A0A8S3TF05_MYTED|nr:HMCN [Mytilus edulis]